MMTDKQIIEQRQICLYQDTCLHLKEKTRVCEDCVHHKNYWSELLAKDQAEKIKKLEQECEELKEKLKTKAKGWANVNDKILEEVKQIRVENEKLKTALKFRDSNIDTKNKEILKKCKNNRELIDKNWKLIKTLTEIKEIIEQGVKIHDDIIVSKQILQKISEVEDG